MNSVSRPNTGEGLADLGSLYATNPNCLSRTKAATLDT
jgi:hypothetical protein